MVRWIPGVIDIGEFIGQGLTLDFPDLAHGSAGLAQCQVVSTGSRRYGQSFRLHPGILVLASVCNKHTSSPALTVPTKR